MSDKKNNNPGVVNTNAVKANVTGVTTKPCKDGRTHVSAYDGNKHARLSWNIYSDGKIGDVHSTDGHGNHTTYKGGY